MNWLSPCLVACITLASVACSRYEALPPTDAGFSVLDPDSADASEARQDDDTDVHSLDTSPIEPDGETDGAIGASNDVEDEDAAVSRPEPDMSESDALEDVETPDAEADAELDGAIDGLGPSPDADDAQEVEDSSPACVSTCEVAGTFRCAPEVSTQLQICEPDGTREGDCLTWTVYTECTTDDLCAGVPMCEDGACTVDTSQVVICPPSNEPCQPLECQPETGQCEPSPVPEGGGCDDLDPCTVLDKCTSDGSCTGLPNTAACGCNDDEDCLGLDDGDACNGRYRCVPALSGSALYCQYDPEPTVCGDDPSGCNTLSCDPESEQCLPTPVEDGLTCDDGEACTLSASCVGGACVAQTEVVCDAGLCETAYCDAETGACITEWLDDCCGNGVPEGEEECEPGGSVACTAECTFEVCSPRALEFAGGCVFIPVTGDPLTVSQSIRVELFLELGSGQGTLLDFPGPDEDAGWRLEVVEQDGERRYQWVELQADGAELVTAGPLVPELQWHHLAVTRQPDLAQVHVQWFINGVVAEDAKFTGTARAIGGGDGAWLGCRAGSDALHGRVDEVRIGVDALSTVEVPQGPLLPTAADLLLYHFDDVTPGVAVDATGNELHGVWLGPVATDDQPLVGAQSSCSEAWCARNALYFEASSEAEVSAPPNPGAEGTQTFTVEFYIRLDSTESGQVILGFDDGVVGNPDWHISVVPFVGQSVRLLWSEGQLPGLDNAISSPPLTTGVVYHVAIERVVEEPGSGQLTWYVNGLKDTAKSLDGALALAWEERTMWVGSHQGQSGFFTGWFDELRISKGALYGGDFEKPTALLARWDTYALYHFDTGAGWIYNVAPTAALPIVNVGATPMADFTSPITPCP